MLHFLKHFCALMKPNNFLVRERGLLLMRLRKHFSFRKMRKAAKARKT